MMSKWTGTPFAAQDLIFLPTNAWRRFSETRRTQLSFLSPVLPEEPTGRMPMGSSVVARFCSLRNQFAQGGCLEIQRRCQKEMGFPEICEICTHVNCTWRRRKLTLKEENGRQSLDIMMSSM